jgi:glycosyltransferase involved in cell wall biosynthesis
VSDAIKNDMRHFPYIKQKLVVIKNAVTCPVLVPRAAARGTHLASPESNYWIGMLSELHPTKRVDDAITAFAKITAANPSAILVVISEGSERARLEALIKKLGLTDKIFLVGFVADAAQYFSAFDIFLHTSQSEALAYVILEAGCSSLPVVATHVGGIPEVITDKETGLLVPPRSPALVAMDLSRLIHDPALAAHLGASLHTRVLKDFSASKMLSTTFALYDGAILV